jgi:uncharacterized protein (TIGR03067 family)
MKSFAVLLIFAPVAFAAGEPSQEAIQKELQKFQGTWQLVSSVSNGKEVPDDHVKNIKVVIKGNKHTVYYGDKEVAKNVPFQIDPSKNPKTVDDILKDGKKILGIYEIKGNTLKSCVATVGKDRPTQFVSKPGSGHALRIFKRAEKPGQ